MSDLHEERPPTESQEPTRNSESFWTLVAQASMLGWNLVVPIVGGVLLGRYLDDTFEKEYTWTLSLLLMGVAVAFNNLYSMYIEHSDAEPLRERMRKRSQKRHQNKSEEDENRAKDT